MSLSLRPLVGIGAAFLTMAMVVIAGDDSAGRKNRHACGDRMP